MARIDSIVREVERLDPDIARRLKGEVNALSGRRSFGLNFERHQPDSVDMPKREITVGDKVRMIPPRGKLENNPDTRIWYVTSIDDGIAQLQRVYDEEEIEQCEVDNLWVIAEFQDEIYPGLEMTGEVINDDEDAHFQTVINGENHHVLQALTYTHKHAIDVIYIDPPYNTGAKDWKYNNDYVSGEDEYRHSKWLSFMEKRLLIAKQLLNPDDSVLICTIDEKEYLRLGLLLEQTFPEARIQMVSSVINPAASSRGNAFGRTDEYIFFVKIGKAAPVPMKLDEEWSSSRKEKTETTATEKEAHWDTLIRSGSGSLREDRANLFYPIFVHKVKGGADIHSVGESYYGDRSEYPQQNVPEGCVAVWPMKTRTNEEGRWQLNQAAIRELKNDGFLKTGKWRGERTTVYYFARGQREKLEEGIFTQKGTRHDGSRIIMESVGDSVGLPGTLWMRSSHSATDHGTNLNTAIFGRSGRFNYPKSLYAVEDALRFFVKDKPDATVLDFFCGSGTTTHAVLRLNKQDEGRRRSIIVTNNEVSDKEQISLRRQGLRPGDAEWEALGICDYVTKPRVTAAITGKTPDGEPIKGDYKFTDEFPMSDGFAANARYFTLTYENPVAIEHDLSFHRIAPLLWIKAGARGPVISDLSERGWSMTSHYAVLDDADRSREFIAALRGSSVETVFIVTDDQRLYQSIVAEVPAHVETVRLYESYLSNFKFLNGDSE